MRPKTDATRIEVRRRKQEILYAFREFVRNRDEERV